MRVLSEESCTGKRKPLEAIMGRMVYLMKSCGLFSFIASSCALFLAACAGGPAASGDTMLPIPDQTTAVSIGDIRIAPMDTLQIDVFGVDELNGAYQVDFGGVLKMPLIDEISVVGMTASELALVLETSYEETWLQNPNVNVTIADSVGRRITLDGAVSAPGLYPVTGNLTLLQAVALGGGPHEGANPKKVVVFRQINGERHAAAFNLVDIRNGKASDPAVYGNDIIVVDGSEARRTYGEILRSLPLIALFTAF